MDSMLPPEPFRQYFLVGVAVGVSVGLLVGQVVGDVILLVFAR